MSARSTIATGTRVEALKARDFESRRRTRRRPRWLALAAAVVLALGGAIAWRVLASSEGAAGDASGVTANVPATSLTIQQIMPRLTRSGIAREIAPGWGDTVDVDVTYAPPLFFRVTGQQLPAGADAEPTLVFFLQENIHGGYLPAAAPAALLQVDGGSRIAPRDRTLISDDPHHRITRLQFAASAAGAQTLTLLIPAKDGSVPKGGQLTWRLPIVLGPAGKAPAKSEHSAAKQAEAGTLGLSALDRTLHKSVSGVRLGSLRGVQVEAIYATPGYFKEALPPSATAKFVPKRNFVFVLTETVHSGNLPGALPQLRLYVGGKTYKPDLAERKLVSPHHQVSFVRFPGDPTLADRLGVMRLALPDGSSLDWALPLSFTSSSGAMSPFGVPWASLFALFGGFLGAMWPCLFQLTVFFMPTLAGIGAQQAAKGDGRGAQRAIAKAALFFILGYSIVYTSGGALIGFAAQELKNTDQFLTIERYAGIVGGLIILVMAGRVAVRGRAPLVCKMPIAPRMKRKDGASPLEMMMAGLAFATGCMTCFGTALVIGMVVYVGLSNSALYGAFMLGTFSLGMGIPLFIAAMLMGRVMPHLAKMERAMPWMALTSSVIMIGFAGLLFSGNYMALSGWFYGLTH